MRPLLFSAAFLLLAGCGKEPRPPLPPPTGSPVVADDTARIQGEWRATGIRHEEGKPEEPTVGWSLRFENGTYVMQLEDEETGTFSLLQSYSPKWIDLVTKDGDLRRGLYSLDGEKLAVCFPEPKNAERPAAIKAAPDENRTFVITFTRTK